MPELTEITDAPVTNPETEPRIEDDDDEDSDNTIPELEDTGQSNIFLNYFFILSSCFQKCNKYRTYDNCNAMAPDTIMSQFRVTKLCHCSAAAGKHK